MIEAQRAIKKVQRPLVDLASACQNPV